MAEGDNREKTEPATPKRLEDARKKGQLAQSKEIPATLVLLAGLLGFYFLGSYMSDNLLVIIRDLLGGVATDELTETNACNLLLSLLGQLGLALAPLMLMFLTAGIAGNVLQNRFLFTMEPLTPKFSKLDPIKGVTKLFSMQSLVEMFKSVAKIVIVGYVAYVTVKGEKENLLPLMMMEPVNILTYIGKVSFKICVRTLWVLVPLVALDYAFQRWNYNKSLKMTKQEVKDEFKHREGDPLIKGRIRSVQREMARRRMMEEVPEADVVITNPTELAIALRYDREAMSSPKVVAKGAGFVAKRIREIAVESRVPVVEDKPLARSLYKLVDIGQVIPPDMYKAVAEVLAYVYRLKNRIQ